VHTTGVWCCTARAAASEPGALVRARVAVRCQCNTWDRSLVSTGTTTGLLAGAAARRRAKEQAAQQQEQARAAAAQQKTTYNRAYSACMEGKGYTAK
jgi:hypothetical protein